MCICIGTSSEGQVEGFVSSLSWMVSTRLPVSSTSTIQSAWSGDPSVGVDSVTHDSRAVRPGALFCCVTGLRVDGHDFAANAVAAGATSLLCERELDVDAAQLIVADVRAAMARAAAEVAELLARFPGARTAKVKVAEPGQSLADDVARVNAVRAVVPTVRVDANGGWTVEDAVTAAAATTTTITTTSTRSPRRWPLT